MKVGVRTIFLTLLFLSLCSLSAYALDQRVYDQANLLSQDEVQHLEGLASNYFEEWNTDFLIVTTESKGGKSIEQYVEEKTDELYEILNREEDNMVVLTLAMDSSEVHVAGFGLGEEYVDDQRVEYILDHIVPLLAEDNYFGAFELFYEKADDYLQVRPGVNPDSIFLNTFFQLFVSIIVAGIIIFILVYRSSGKAPPKNGFYLSQTSNILKRKDRYLRKTVTRRAKPQPKNRSGGGGFPGGGGGVTGAGRSYSGGSRKF